TILSEGRYFLTDDHQPARKATVVYSGGDDVFIVGEWSDIVGFAVDLNESLKKYSQGTLTMSAGIGIYPEKYPVSAMARQTGELEDISKSFPGKNAVTLFSGENTYSWPVFIDKVLNEKYRLIKSFFDSAECYGKAYLYNLLDLMKKRDNKLNIARYAYFLAKMQPNENADVEQKRVYTEFSEKMYYWITHSEEECRQAITAIYIYLYTIREKEE
ncbi:MAG: type III-A CRISPR-associated protein Cas10/Csm1, partial [Clostridiales bacterium]|nr:type III-A CRISPR-associated protein Cas10/Csm1 [Clostridiales bacterium]